MYNWDVTKFTTHVTHGYWNKLTNQRDFMQQLQIKLSITDHEAWDKVTTANLLQHGGRSLLDKYNGSLSKLLTTVLPEYRQACRERLIRTARDLKLPKVEDLITVPLEYPPTLSQHVDSFLGFSGPHTFHVRYNNIITLYPNVPVSCSIH